MTRCRPSASANAGLVPSVADPSSPPSGLWVRTASAAVLAPLVLYIVYLGSPYFDALVGLGALILIREWWAMTRHARPRGPWLGLGFLYIAVPCLSLLWLRLDPVAGRDLVFWLMGVVWAADSGAYLAGRAIGGPKMAPRISPKKTWAGLIGGLISAGAVGWLVADFLSADGVARPVVMVVLAVAIGFVAEMGDLLESWLKRRLDVKDSGALIPGHGGLFDRVDGLFTAAVALVLVLEITQGRMLAWF